MNLLITGGAGFIGSHLVDRVLADSRARVTVVDDFNDFYDPAIKRANVSPHLAREDFELVEADICDSRAMDRLFERERFDVVVHLAARAGVRPSLVLPLEYARTNVLGTYSLLEGARRHAVKQFIFGSSSSVYGIGARVPFSEDAALVHPISPYAATKIAAESACRVYSHLYGIRVVCLRFFTVYGARQRPDLAIHKFARLIAEGKPLPLYGDGTTRRDYTYIDDIMAGVLAAMSYEKSAFEIINLGESQTVELRRLVELLENAMGKRAVIDYQSAQPGDVPLTYADVSKARLLLGYNPTTSIEVGIEKFVGWFDGGRRPDR
ncbi:MAG TPA: GDP-mannose 4,6-dehydratase [Blastocatellia bacterium]|nr:GDP-mannose 4,6-dehydratase [Blastocatellia bacterium]